MVQGSILLNLALGKVVNVRVGEEFTLKDLFTGLDWKRIEKRQRLALGSEFFKFVNSSENLLPIRATGKTKSHKQKYIIEDATFTLNSFLEEYDEEEDED